MGVTTKKKTIPITIGETNFPKIIPNLNQSLFRGVKILELNNPNKRKIIDIIKLHILISASLINGQRDIIKKKQKKLAQSFYLMKF